MATNLDLMTTSPGRGSELEVFDAENAWTDASSPIFVETNRWRGGVYQMGYDPIADQHWIRSYTGADGAWSEWEVFPAKTPGPPGRTARAELRESETKRKR